MDIGSTIDKGLHLKASNRPRCLLLHIKLSAGSLPRPRNLSLLPNTEYLDFEES